MPRNKDQAIAAGVKVSETHHSMKRRKPWHNYSRKGTYMLTIVVDRRRPLLGRLVTPAAADLTRGKPRADARGVVAPTGTAAVVAAPTPRASARGQECASAQGLERASAQGPLPFVELTALGRAIRDEEVPKISVLFRQVEVWKLCVMPDHLHMVVHIREDLPQGKHLGQIVAGFKGGCSRAWWRLDSPCADSHPVSLFERGYNDLILLNEGQLEKWKNYLDDNPRRLAIKRLYPHFFTVTHYVDIAEWHCQTVGNRFLLDIPQKVAVIVHRAYSDEEYADYRRQWLACGEAGGVLVSAAIAVREKEVMREAMNRGYRIILVRENGFPPLYKPAGESFDACSSGQLLQVSPWQYHMARTTISREQCLMLNRLVVAIVEGMY